MVGMRGEVSATRSSKLRSVEKGETTGVSEVRLRSFVRFVKNLCNAICKCLLSDGKAFRKSQARLGHLRRGMRNDFPFSSRNPGKR